MSIWFKQRKLSILHLIILLILLASVSVAPTTVFATVPSSGCVLKFSKKRVNILPPADLAQQALSRYDSPNVKAYSRIKDLASRYQYLKDHSQLLESVELLLQDESLSTFHNMLISVFENLSTKLPLQKLPGMTNKQQVLTALEVILVEELQRFMPSEEAKKRASLISEPKMTTEILMRALGHMTAEESLKALIGSDGISKISDDSLVGRYIRESKLAGVNVSKVMNRFPKHHDYNGSGGPKLFIAVDESTRGIAEQIFGKNPHLLIHVHEPDQGTLEMEHNGMPADYAGYTNHGKKLDSLPTGSMAPIVVLSTHEASNTTNYFTLGKLDRKLAKYPWGFKLRGKNGVKRSYCKEGGYNSCTHWVGEMPIGEREVDHLTFPGYRNDDDYANERFDGKVEGDIDPVLQRSKPGKYNMFISRDEEIEINQTERNHRLAQIVWTQGTAREQLWSLVGDKNAEGLAEGEWANPGWVLYSFLTRSNQERVPVVLVYVEDASARLTKQKVNELEALIETR